MRRSRLSMVAIPQIDSSTLEIGYPIEGLVGAGEQRRQTLRRRIKTVFQGPNAVAATTGGRAFAADLAL